MDEVATINAPPLLPHLAKWMIGEKAPAPWDFGPWEEREKLLKTLPPRVWPLVLCEYAQSVLGIWIDYSTTDNRPQKAIQSRLNWCRAAYAASTAGAARAAYAAYAAGAAGAAGAARAAYAAGATHAAHAAGAARAAHAAYAAGAAGAAGAARAAYAAHAASAASTASTAYVAYAAHAAHVAYAAQWRWMRAVFNAARPIQWNPNWTTTTVIALAEHIWAHPDDRGTFAILADALQDAGCDNSKMLNRLRSKKGPHTRADVAVWAPLGLDTTLTEIHHACP